MDQALIVEKLEAIVGSTLVHPFIDLEPDWQAKITQAVTPSSALACMVSPNSQEELAAVMACAYHQKWRMLLAGQGSKLGWGGLVKEPQVLISSQRLDRLIDHAVGDLTVTVEAGMPFAALQAILAKEGQFLPLDPTFRHRATLGGIIATADTGSLRQRYGGVRDLLLGISFSRADGQMAKAGGRVVKNVAGYDLMKLFTGAYGTLGFITQMTLRLYPLPENSQTLLVTGNISKITQAREILFRSVLTPTAADLLSPHLSALLGVEQASGLVIRFQGLEASVQEQSRQWQSITQELKLSITSHLDQEEVLLWKRLQEVRELQDSAVTCKIGVLPADGVEALAMLETIAKKHNLSALKTMGILHAGSGLGVIRFQGSPEDNLCKALVEFRTYCQERQGFLSILEAPVELKQKIDVWGYTSNSLGLMRSLKNQFDPGKLLNPNRFVGDI
ncbi:MAG: FAD-binding oxidoreductase [Kovacikia sp.]